MSFSDKRSGFTLVELMIVVIIIGVLAGIAIPRFIRTAEKARGDEAVTNLRLIFFAGQRMYRVDNNTYTLVDANFSPLAPDYINNPNANPDRAFDYTIPAANATTFTAQAERRAGPYAGGTISIDENEDITTGGGWPFTY